MKNGLEQMPSTDSDQNKPQINDSDIDDLLKALDEHGDAERTAKQERADRDMQEALRQLDAALDATKDHEATLDAERQVEAALKEFDAPPEPEALPVDNKRSKEMLHPAILGDARLSRGLRELISSRVTDTVLEHYKPDFAAKELFEKPFNAILETMGISADNETEDVAEALLRANNPGYATMSPEKQATARELIGKMASKIIGDLRSKWHSGIISLIKNKREALIDNQFELETAKTTVMDNPVALKMHQESIEKNLRLIENADSLISGFEHSS